jgi:Rrf2 family transcriptional regulator, iron-sulfur cluster assembly transcription factor
MFSKACEYGIRATLHIASQSQMNNRVSLKEIAEAIDSPEAFTAKILQQLSRSGIIESTKGAAGGFEISKQQLAKITLSQIVTAIDGDQIYRGCGLGLKECNEAKPCPVHYEFKAIRDDLANMLEMTRIRDLVSGLHAGLTFLKQ